MKIAGMRLVQQPDAVKPKTCFACKDFLAECYVPIGEGSAQMCWLCAHAVVEHDCPPHEASTHECECLPHQVYPNREPPKPVVDEGDTVVVCIPSESGLEIRLHAEWCENLTSVAPVRKDRVRRKAS